MKNKIELKKSIICCIGIIIIFILILWFSNYYQYKKYTNNYNIKINAIIKEVLNNCPELNTTELIKILNANNNEDTELLKQYGIDIKNDSIIVENDKYYIEFLIINIFILILCSIFILFIFLRYNKNKDNTLKEITKYIEEINRKNYKLNIEDNTEDELSILKNEIYKTTIMLKEVAENSKKDKINLKNSLSDISHQLKTPLTSITIMLDNIIETPNMSDDTKKGFLKDIKREIININFLISSLLKLSRLDANSVVFINQEVLIKKVIDEAVKNVSALSDLNKVDILVHGNEEDKIFCDFKWQVEAITNILKNCVEHSKNDSKIYIFWEKTKTYSKIVIEDNGKGICEEDLPHIFERFYKGKNSSSESVGIGLALSKSIIENSNGYIKVESEVNKGTKFIIYLYCQ